MENYVQKCEFMYSAEGDNIEVLRVPHVDASIGIIVTEGNIVSEVILCHASALKLAGAIMQLVKEGRDG